MLKVSGPRPVRTVCRFTSIVVLFLLAGVACSSKNTSSAPSAPPTITYQSNGQGAQTSPSPVPPRSDVTSAAASRQEEELLLGIESVIRDTAEVNKGINTYLANCMRARGFDVLEFDISGKSPSLAMAADTAVGGSGALVWARYYHFPNPDAASPTPEYAEKYGYGIIYEQEGEPQVGHDENGVPYPMDPFLKMPEDYQIRYGIEMTGVRDEITSGVRVKPVEQTCQGQANALFGSIYHEAPPDFIDILSGPTGTDGYKQFGDSQAWAKARDGWLGCMTNKGYSGMTNIYPSRVVSLMLGMDPSGFDGDFSWAPKLEYFKDPSRVKEIEFQVAKADAQCALDNNVNQVYRDEMAKLRLSYVRSHADKVQSYIDWNRQRMADAKKALENG